MDRLLSPLCLACALGMLFCGFAVLGFGVPEAEVEFHQALSTGNDDLADVLAANLLKRRFARRVLLSCLFGGSVTLIGAAFFLMRPAERR